MKRFTETEKWKDIWFRSLPPGSKLLWQYICDNCDNSGVWEPDLDLAEFKIGMKLDAAQCLKDLSKNIEILKSGKWYVKTFILFQQKELSENKPFHKQIISLCHKHGIAIPYVSHRDTIGIPTSNGIGIGKVKKESVRGNKTKLTDSEFIESLKSNTAYHGIDVQAQLGKMDAWLLANPSRQKTRKFIVAWLNRCEKPLQPQSEKKPSYSFDSFKA